MKQVKLMKRGEGCRVCGHRGLIISSAFDGRPSYKCDRCGYYETRGIKPGQGKRWRRELNSTPQPPDQSTLPLLEPADAV